MVRNSSWSQPKTASTLIEKVAGISLDTRNYTDQRSHADFSFAGAAAEKLEGGDDSLPSDVLDTVLVLSAAKMLCIGQAVFDTTLDHPNQGVQFNQTLTTLQALQHCVADLFAHLA